MQRKRWDLPDWMERNLGTISKDLAWQFGPAVREAGHRLVVTPETQHHLRPLVSRMLNRAPKLDGWEFYGYRLPEVFGMVEQVVGAHTGGSVAGVSFQAKINDVNKIDLLFHSPDHASIVEALEDVFLATETLVGEEVLDRWIGDMNLVPRHRRLKGFQPLRDLSHVVNGLKEEVAKSLPDVPYFRLPRQDSRTMREPDPQKAQDYPQRQDMHVGNSTIDALWENAHSRQSFDSVRFSRQGEVFCYAKIDGTAESGVAGMGEIADAVDAALRNAEVGCCVGDGTGLRYRYLDMGLTDVQMGTQVVQRVLRERNVPRRSWIQYFDTDFQAEWTGVWDDSPRPPMPHFG